MNWVFKTVAAAGCTIQGINLLSDWENIPMIIFGFIFLIAGLFLERDIICNDISQEDSVQ